MPHFPVKHQVVHRKAADTPENRQRLAELIAEVQKNSQGFWDTGRAIMAIRQESLWTLTHTSWQAFCEQSLGWTASRVRRLTINTRTAFEILDDPQMSRWVRKREDSARSGNSYIDNEEQLSALSKVPHEDRPTIVEMAERSGCITGRTIADAAEELAAEKAAGEVKAGKRPDVRIPDHVKEAIKAGEAFTVLARRIRTVANGAFVLAVDASLIGRLNTVASDLERLRPYSDCVYCAMKGCSKCGDHGWLTYAAFCAVDELLRKTSRMVGKG